jgi:hypothetical protein
MKLRVAGLLCLATLTLVPTLAYAQKSPTPTRGGGKETIEFLYNRIQALEARLAKLEAGRVESAEIVGRYSLHAFGVQLMANPLARVSNEASSGILTFNADKTVCPSGVKDARWNLFQGAPWYLEYTEDIYPDVCRNWDIVDGTLVIFEPGDEDVELTISAGARILIGGGTSNASAWANIFMLVKLPKE